MFRGHSPPTPPSAQSDINQLASARTSGDRDIRGEEGQGEAYRCRPSLPVAVAESLSPCRRAPEIWTEPTGVGSHEGVGDVRWSVLEVQVGGGASWLEVEVES